MTVPELEVSMMLVASAAAFLLSGAYYTVVPRPATAGEDANAGAMSPWLMVAELVRVLVLVAVVAVLMDLSGVSGWGEGAIFGFVLWVGFPLVLWVGAILHERTPWRMAALHGGDWLLKLVVIAVILGL